jgi:hypothetical protein
MAQQNRSTIKTFFETGDIPTQAQFGDSFDSQVFWVDDVETTLGTTDTKVPTSKAVNDAMVFTKDAENNIFYNGVTPTLGTLCRRNIFYQASDATLGNGCQENVFFPRVGTITLGTGCIKNIFEGGTNITFANSLLNVVVKSSTIGGSDYTNLTNYGFMYNNTYPAIIFGVGGTTNYHQYYDIANNRIVTTNLTTLAVVNISGGAGTVTSVNAGTNISVTGTAAAPIINSLSDRYKTTSTTSNTIGNGSRTFTVDANLSYIPLQEVLIVYDPSNHMHGSVTSYNSTTGELIVDVKHHTGGPGPFTSWVINLDGVPIDAITGAGTANRLAYFTAGQVIDDVAAITASRALISDANGLPTHSATTSIELGYVSGVTSAIQTQLNAKTDTFTTFSTIGTWASPAASTTYYAPIFGGIGIPLTAITTFLNAFTFATKIVGINVQHINNGGTQGSNQNVAIQLRNHTTSTSTQLINIQTNQLNGVSKIWEDYSLNVSIAANDQIALQINTPAWSSLPTNAVIRVTLFIQRT